MLEELDVLMNTAVAQLTSLQRYDDVGKDCALARVSIACCARNADTAKRARLCSRSTWPGGSVLSVWWLLLHLLRRDGFPRDQQSLFLGFHVAHCS